MIIPSTRLLSRLTQYLPVGLLALTLAATDANAGSREQALQIHNRVAGVPPTEAVLLQMAAQIDAGQTAEAVKIAMNNEAFYSVTLKNMATPWTNRDQTVFAPLNDYVATIIGLVRDNADFRTALYDDVIYTSNASGLPAYSNANNSHYEAIESQGVSLKDTLVRRTQSSLNGLPADATSGVITSRAAAKAFFIAGTNRAMFRFTLLNHLCRDLEQVHDTSLVPDFIRQDVSRSPGGDSRVFLNNCIGCHNGMDPMAKAYAYYDYEFDINGDPDGINGAIHYNGEGTLDPDTNSRVEKKYRINSSTFKPGYVTTNDDWLNYWRKGQNSYLGWGWNSPTLTGSGTGAKSMNMELAHSKAFASCQVEKVFQNVCLRKPGDATDRAKIEEFTQNFAANNYQLKQVFIDTANYCKGQ
ncbi:hypothetical protein [Cellvibrio sp. KY-GH-1]|uniref:hypothetical protein n=1 Tax=Cellvibrio sp. KY-GH-1 TaxID=2303332 RepID=UPI001785806A|nr:hypothetical protein [Cellvibrio sp. KY-GH-1]